MWDLVGLVMQEPCYNLQAAHHLHLHWTQQTWFWLSQIVTSPCTRVYGVHMKLIFRKKLESLFWLQGAGIGNVRIGFLITVSLKTRECGHVWPVVLWHSHTSCTWTHTHTSYFSGSSSINLPTLYIFAEFWLSKVYQPTTIRDEWRTSTQARLMASMKYMSSSAALGCVLGLLARLYDWHSNRYVWMLALPAMFFAKQCCQMSCRAQFFILFQPWDIWWAWVIFWSGQD